MQRVLIRGHMRSGTTILFKILNSLENVHITHELCTYDRFFETKSNNRNLKKFLEMIYQPSRLNGNNNEFSKINMEELEKTLNKFNSENRNWNPLDMIKTIENFIFDKNSKIVGDKDPHWNRFNELQEFKKIGIKPKIIFTYRDGRDVVSSMYRGYKETQPNKRVCWHKEDPKLGAFSWVKVMRKFFQDWLVYSHEYDILPHKFEDLLYDKEKASKKLSNFLDVDYTKILEIINDLVRPPKEAHNKYYREVFPHWKKETSKEFQLYLQLLGYI